MSDGNFNRALLPRTDFQSGVRAGKAAARTIAEEAFNLTLEEVFSSITEEQKETARKFFLQQIRKEQ
ncbi:MAG: hypothetical protein WCR53_06510 [Bacteroidaceae bacterium]|jgi:hypothetical protein|nr:hypothetical protein [Bacteroidaceae bacterium]